MKNINSSGVVTFLFLSIVLVFGIWYNVFAQQPTQQPTPSGNVQYLLKSDMNLLKGLVRQEEGYYIITVSEGRGDLYVRKNQTVAVTNTIEEAYAQRVEMMTCLDAPSYVQLADWCLKYNLMNQAEENLQKARRIQPEYPYIAVIQRRLEFAKKEQARRAQMEAQIASEPQSEEDILAKENMGLAKSNELRMQQEALEMMAKNMPGDTVKQFTTEIQPLLLNSCGTTYCHGEQSVNGFKLFKSNRSRTITLKNLYAVLRQINRETPQESAILIKAAEAHGTLEIPVWNRSRTSSYSRLVGWTYRVSRPSKALPREQVAILDRAIGVKPSTGSNSSRNTEATFAELVEQNSQLAAQSADNSFPNVTGTTIPSQVGTPVGANAGATVDSFEPQYTTDYDYEQYGNQTVNRMSVNGQEYASPAGLPGPRNMPTPAAQRLQQIQNQQQFNNQRQYNSNNSQPVTPSMSQGNTQSTNTPSIRVPTYTAGQIVLPPPPQEDNSHLIREARHAKPIESLDLAQPPTEITNNTPATTLVVPASPTQEQAQAQQYVPAQQKYTVQQSAPVPVQKQISVEQQVPIQNQNSVEQQSIPTSKQPVQTQPASSPKRQNRVPVEENTTDDGYDALPRLDKLFGN